MPRTQPPSARLASIQRTFTTLGAVHVAAHHIEWMLSELGARLGTPPESQGIPPWATELREALAQLTEKVTTMDTNLDKIAQDWPELKALIGQALDQMASKTGDLAKTDASDPRAEQLHGEIQDMIAKLRSAVDAGSAKPAGGGDSSSSSDASTTTPPSTQGSTTGSVSA